MRVAYLKRNGLVQIREVSRPVAGNNQIVVRVEASGICGSDIHAARLNEDFQPFGHEVAGRIEELGPGVDHLSVGQRIVLDSATPCGRCAMCKNGCQELCTDIQSFYFLNSFGMADAMVAPAICAIPYEGLRPQEAALSEPLGVALDLVRVSGLQAGDNVLLMGPGPIGLMALRVARLAGAGKIFVSALSSTALRNRLAIEFGADAVIEVDKTPLNQYPFGCQINRVLSTTPPATLASAFEVAGKGAVIAFIGLAGASSPTIPVDADAFHFKKLQLRASFASPALYGPKALELIQKDELIRTRMISHEFPLDEVGRAMDVAMNDAANPVKVMVLP